MSRIVRSLVCLALLVSMAQATSAQQGHPLDGTWYGDWGPTPDHRNPVVVVLRYDGENLSGLINPGPNSIPIDVLTLDLSDWTVHIEASAVNFRGETVQYQVDGQIGDLGLPNRTMTGTWNHDGTEGDFRLTRN